METPLFDVFISYAHEDIEWARWLYDGLSSRGLTVFLDDAVLRFGDNIPARVEESLEHSIAVLLLLSRESRDSAWVKFESSFDWTSTFLDGRRKLIPVVIEKGCEIPARLRNLHSCEFTHKDDAKLQRLVHDLLSRTDLQIGPYQLHRGTQLPEELVKSVLRCVKRYIQPDERQLLLVETAITELVDNAFRHTSTGRVSLKVHATSSFAEVVVSDSGDGFDLRDSLVASRRLLEDEPTVVGRRGLTLLEAQGVRLLNGVSDDRQHWVKAIVWWNPPIHVPDGPALVNVRPNGCLTVSLSGRIDQYTAGPLEAALTAYVHDPKTNGIVFDLTNVDYVSSIGMRILMLFAKVARVNEYQMVVAGLQPRVAELFTIARFDQVLKAFESLEEAESAVDASL